MNEPKPDYGAMNRQELRQDLEGYDFVTPTGEHSGRYWIP